MVTNLYKWFWYVHVARFYSNELTYPKKKQAASANIYFVIKEKLRAFPLPQPCTAIADRANNSRTLYLLAVAKFVYSFHQSDG